MTHEAVDALWLEGMAFENSTDGFKFTVDAAKEFGGKNKGPKPKLLLLNALAGCTGMDVVSILSKMKQELSWFNVRVEGDLGDEHPRLTRLSASPSSSRSPTIWMMPKSGRP